MDKKWLSEVERIIKDTIKEIEYKAEPKGVNQWQTPAETVELGTGDCEDIQLLIRARLFDFNLIDEGRLLLGRDKQLGRHAVLKIKDPDGSEHFICNVNGLRDIADFEIERELNPTWMV